jgi:hypothetical protein
MSKLLFGKNLPTIALYAAVVGFLLLSNQQATVAQNDLTPPAAPDYTQKNCWSALPFRQDAADDTPKGIAAVADEQKTVDVFYIYPTMYRKGDKWNADIYDADLNKRIDSKPVHFQASVFNGVGRIYAPRYRQAHINAYFTEDRNSADKAFDIAYDDVLTAFKYYLEHYNQGRPFILAGHSQGTTHARRLAKDMIDGKPLAKQLVAAYLVGMPIKPDLYEHLKPCETPEQVGCFVSWMSYKEGYEPKATAILQGGVIINPVTWQLGNNEPSPKSEHEGSVLANLNKKSPNSLTAKVHDGILWVKSKKFLTKLFNDYHIVDYNLFWYDIRKHVAEQATQYFKQSTANK